MANLITKGKGEEMNLFLNLCEVKTVWRKKILHSFIIRITYTAFLRRVKYFVKNVIFDSLLLLK